MANDHPACIDISHWQGFPDFKQVADAGVIALIHKCTEGTGYVDPNRAYNIHNAIANGIVCCTYHWLKPGNAKAQMDFYLKTLNPVRGERVIIDYEEDGCTLSDLHDAVSELLSDPRELQITVYSGHLLKQQLGNNHDDLLASHTDLWLAQYTTGQPTWPDETYPHWTLWQHSESGNVAGITGSEVDLNNFNGSNDALVKWMSPAEATLPQPPEPLPDDVTIVSVSIDTPRNVNVKVTINGEVWTAPKELSPQAPWRTPSA